MSNFVLQVPDAVQSAIKYGSEYEDFNHPIYQMITHDFLDFFSKNFQQTVNIYMVGSRVMALGTEKSDLSFFVAYDNTHYLMGLPDPRIQVISVKNTRSALLTNPSWNVVESSNDFLVALHCATGMRCKFSFFDGFYHETSFFIKYLLELQPEARKLVYFAKIWFKHENIKMNGYLITVLVIFFLQQKKLLPSVQAIQKNCFPYWVRTKNVAFSKNVPLTKYGFFLKMQNYLKYVGDFFKFYATYEFDNFVICPYLGESVSKFQNSEAIIDLKWHINTTPVNWNIYDKIVILEPLNSSNNLAYLMDNVETSNFIQCCSSTAHLLEKSDIYSGESEEPVVDPDMAATIFD